MNLIIGKEIRLTKTPYSHPQMEEATITASIDEGHFGSSVRLDVAGKIKIRDTCFEFDGCLAKGPEHTFTWTWFDVESKMGIPPKEEYYYIHTSLGDLKLRDIRKLYAQITG